MSSIPKSERSKALTVGELREAIAGVPDHYEVTVRVLHEGDDAAINYVGELTSANVEHTHCADEDGEDQPYLALDSFSYDDDEEEAPPVRRFASRDDARRLAEERSRYVKDERARRARSGGTPLQASRHLYMAAGLQEVHIVGVEYILSTSRSIDEARGRLSRLVALRLARGQLRLVRELRSMFGADGAAEAVVLKTARGYRACARERVLLLQVQS